MGHRNTHLKQSRLAFFLISDINISTFVKNADVKAGRGTDHCMITLTLTIGKAPKNNHGSLLSLIER